MLLFINDDGWKELVRTYLIVLMGSSVLVGIIVIVMKFLFEYDGLTHGYMHYIFLICLGSILMLILIHYLISGLIYAVPISFFIFISFVIIIVSLDEFLIYAIQNFRDLKQEVTGIILDFFH